MAADILDKSLANVVYHKYIAPNYLVKFLDLNGYRFISNVRDDGATTIFSQAWKSGHLLGLNEAKSREWSIYVEALQGAHIRICEVEDLLVWDKSLDGKHNPKAGYFSICVESFNHEIKWW